MCDRLTTDGELLLQGKRSIMETQKGECYHDGTQRRGSDPHISGVSTRRPSQYQITRRHSSTSHRQHRDLHLQHSWIMVIASRNRRCQLRGNAKQPQRLFHERNLPSCCHSNQHPRTQLWQPVSPFEECPLLLLALASNGKTLEKVGRSEHCRSRSAGAVDLLRSTHIGQAAAITSRTCKQTTNSVAGANHPDSHISQTVRSYDNANPVDRPQQHLLATFRDPLPILATPTRSGVGIPRSKVTHTPSRVPSPKILAHTSSTQTVNRMAAAATTTSLQLGGAHQVPLEIHIPGSTDRSLTVDHGAENPTRDSEVDEEGGDEYSELSLDEELLVTKLGKSKNKTSSTSHSNSSCSQGHFIDHPLFHEAVDLAEFYPTLSKFHISLGTTHDSTWGITTAMLEGAEDANWPSDEERTADKNSKTKKKLPRRRCHTVDSIRSTREDSVRDAAPREWEHTGYSAGVELCSSGQVRQSFFHPVFPGRKIPWQTTCRNDNHGDHDDDYSSEDGNDWKWQPASCKRERSSKSTTAAMSYKEFQLSSSQTDTTEASSTVEKSCSSRL